MQHTADHATSHESRDHSDLEAEDRNRRAERQNETPNIEACQHRRIKAKAESANMARGAKHRVNCDQIARLRMTPTTAAVIAESAPARGLLPRSCSM
jgi:hypothetical protein